MSTVEVVFIAVAVPLAAADTLPALPALVAVAPPVAASAPLALPAEVLAAVAPAPPAICVA